MATRREFVTAAAAAVLARPDLLPAADPKPIAEVPADKPIRVGVPMFPKMDQIDLTGPFAVLSRLPNATVKLLWKAADPIRDYRGLGLIPDAKLGDAGPIDLLVVPGGPGQEDLMEDEAVLSFIAKHAEAAKCVFSVCTGALVCGAAGLLKGKKATTHWASVQFLKYFGATFVDERVVIDGKVVSAAGLTAGIDGALRVAALLRGDAAAKAIQLDIQYAPEPRSTAGTRTRPPKRSSPSSGPPSGRSPRSGRPRRRRWRPGSVCGSMNNGGVGTGTIGRELQMASGTSPSIVTGVTLESIQVGTPCSLGTEGDPADRPWTTGFIKSPVARPLWLARTNLAGDGQADLVNHGGPDKAVCVYPAVHYPHWRVELSLSLEFGSFGENFTAGGLTEADVCIGDVWAVGGAVVQVSQPRQPCWKLARRWAVKDLALRVQQTGRTGWYFRVLREGEVAAGEALALVERPEPAWTVARANEVMHHRKTDFALAAELAAVPTLSASWKTALWNRSEKHVQPDTAKRLECPSTP